MRIARRTSGGRGEYEISEPARGGITPPALVNRRLILNLGHGIMLDSGCVLKHVQGKFRIRLIKPDADMQLHRQLVVALLLPEAIRSNAPMGGGMPVVQRGRYAVETIRIKSVLLDGESALLKVDEVLLRNADHPAEELKFSLRMKAVKRIWEESLSLPAKIQSLIRFHEQLLLKGEPLHKQSEEIVRDIQLDLSDQAADLGIAYNEYTDPLGPLLQLLNDQIAEPDIKVDDIDPDNVELRRRTIREWKRWAAHRGTKSAQFRMRIREAYKATCVVCGKAYPPTQFNRIPGVDAAHILPWANYDLDRTDNGLCLCKLCHWAFDEGILLIDVTGGDYVVRVAQDARDAILASGVPFSLEVFEQRAGRIPQERLPSTPEDWPNVRFLEELRRIQEE